MSLPPNQGLTITGGTTINGGVTLTSQVSQTPPGIAYTTMDGYANGHGWTIQQYGPNTIWIPWTGSGYNSDVGTPLPTAGQTVRDTNGNTATIYHVDSNNGDYETKLIYLTTSVPGFAGDGIVYIQ
jgi:hypothetical protein